jgi:hypothetical protein
MYSFPKPLRFFLVISLFNSAVQAQTAGTDVDRNRLMYLNSLYLQSYIHSDTATFNHLLWADEFTQTNPDGSVFSRKENANRFGKPRFSLIEYFYGDHIEITFLNPDKAVIYVRNPSGFRINGKLETSVSWYKDTYQKRNGEWKCISAVIKNEPF